MNPNGALIMVSKDRRDDGLFGIEFSGFGVASWGESGYIRFCPGYRDKRRNALPPIRSPTNGFLLGRRAFCLGSLQTEARVSNNIPVLSSALCFRSQFL